MDVSLIDIKIDKKAHKERESTFPKTLLLLQIVHSEYTFDS